MGNGRRFSGDRLVHGVTAASYFLLQPLLCFLWLLYCDYKLTGSQVRLRHRLPAHSAPLVLPITTLSCLMIFINLQSDQMCMDPLTGLYNRRYFEGRLERGIRGRCKNRFLFVILLDVNEFKEINDIHGHEAGDRALTQVAEILRTACARQGDFVSRYGGDEFIILGERKHRGEISSMLQCIRDGAEQFSHSHAQGISLSLSAGYAVFGEEENDTPGAFLCRADQRMYQQKALYRGKGEFPGKN